MTIASTFALFHYRITSHIHPTTLIVISPATLQNLRPYSAAARRLRRPQIGGLVAIPTCDWSGYLGLQGRPYGRA
ncbi:hypothetical protein L596_012823 [Steinernema carpocapsae]|uniref:Uncharacterized protein n=1 Tax=Steinernema carpocapsae TaxID=34508 RepID=A0A4U5NZ14_STECR|nr:hypothetical protein L596_012823 [Steinernema carpocapsae]